MSVLNVTLDEGAFFVGLGLPWPPELRLLLEQTLKDGVLVIGQLPDGRLVAELHEGSTQNFAIADQVICCPVICYDSNKIVLSVIWKAKKFELIQINSNIVFSNDKRKKTVDKIDLQIKDKMYVSIRDFSLQNEKVRAFRRERLANWKRNIDRISGGKDYAFNSLIEEVLQIRDLIDHVNRGKHFHFLGLMSRVRLLLIGKPLGLLQLCAAYLDAPLNVYGHASADREYPFEADVVLMMGSIYPDKTDTTFQSIMDIDLWLSFCGLKLNGKSYDNLSIIREIGNTVASHRDLDIQKSVAFLSSGRHEMSENIIVYSIMVADVVLKLAEELIQMERGSGP